MKEKDNEIRSKNIQAFEDYGKDIPRYFTRNECNSANVDSHLLTKVACPKFSSL